MLTLRENALAILHGKQPDKYDDFMNAMQFLLDPIWLSDRTPQDGEFHKDSWGVTKCFLPGAPGAHPHITPDNKVCKNIEEWEKYVQAPNLDVLDWSDAREQANQVNRDEKFVGLFCATGIFERSHFLMGMEDAFCNYLEYPEEMTGAASRTSSSLPPFGARSSSQQQNALVKLSTRLVPCTFITQTATASH